MSTYDEALNIGAQRYADVLEALMSQGLPATFTQTGGMCAAIEVRLDGGMTLLITDAEDSLSWNREDHQGWGVGLYRAQSEYDDGPISFSSTQEGSALALLPLIQQVFLSTTKQASG